jgi:hypothetical protein
MKKLATILAGAALALSGTTVATAQTTTLAERGEAKLAQMLEGRTAGEPVSCINAMRANQLQVIEHVGLVYRAGDTIYVARPSDPRVLGRNDVLVIERFGSQLCKQDVVRTVDRHGGFMTGVVFLDGFVPYKRG